MDHALYYKAQACLLVLNHYPKDLDPLCTSSILCGGFQQGYPVYNNVCYGEQGYLLKTYL